LDREIFPTGNVYWVDSTNTTDGANTAGYGRNPDAPFLTLAYAETQAAAGDTIYLMPGHNEGIADAQIDLDIAGLSVIGLGEGGDVPIIDFDHANASIDIGANNVTIRNIKLRPSITDVLIAIDVEAAKTGAKIIDVEAIPGEDAGGVDDFAAVVEFKAGANDGLVDGLKVHTHASAAGYIAGVRLKGASDNIEIRNCDIKITGAGVVAPINGDTTLSTNLRIHNNLLVSDAEPGIEMVTGTTGVIFDNYIATDLGTKAAAIDCDQAYLFENYYCEVVTETGGIIGTASADD
jgi:hypothetical protein